MKLARPYYPWPSTIGALSLVAWLFVRVNPELFPPDDLPAPLTRDELLPAALGVFVMMVVFDAWLYLRARGRVRGQLEQLQRQIAELFESKRELGTRARTYSDHADKLKMFISERLLETIEYDEKFLHFKNIASEVRHNGVISYDKAQTALKKAQQVCADGDEREYQEAADSLLYLWDLLDLSTTDNIALHVANRIYDCEEHYFQSLLNHDTAAPLPFTPTFAISNALRRALLPITEKPDELGLNGAWKAPARYRDDKFNIDLQGDGELLGNENHMVLLLENLLNNALFYSRQKGFAGRYSRVAMALTRENGDVEFKIYNRGPWISDDEKDKIYQLGFSSRRIREHHGKGLGLYFVNEIAKGFEGVVAFKNIETRADHCTLDIKLGNGEVHREELDIVELQGRPMCRQGDADEPLSKRLEWSYPAPVTSVEVSARGRRKPQLIAQLDRDGSSDHVDEINRLIPRWAVEIRNRKRSASLRFVPLDVRGVQFVARFPSAGSRLESDDQDADNRRHE